MSRKSISVAALAGLLLTASSSIAAIPVAPFSSRPGALYTLYLDFGGFAFNGAWGSGGGTPGTTPAYNSDANANAFSATETLNIQRTWARVAEKYSAFNINVTTVDPAVAAGQAATDTLRQNYYDSQARMMHTVIGGSGAWSGGGGVSFVDKADTVQSLGYHTNWVFSAQAPTDIAFVAEASTHEIGHAMNLYHQSDYASNGTGALVSEYSRNNNGSGSPQNGTYAPVMGVGYYDQRVLWRSGQAHGAFAKVTQNDVLGLATNNGLALVNDGIGHTLATATPLPLTGTTINSALAKGTITTTALAAVTPLGANYTTDYFAFASNGTSITLRVNDGSSSITAGVLDPGSVMLDSLLRIYDVNGTLVGTGTEAANTLSESFTGTLPAGIYYASVTSEGGYQSTFDTSATYYTFGSYFLTGSGGLLIVPEPTSLAGVMVFAAFAVRRRRAA